MNTRHRTDLPPDVYPHDPWALVEEAYAPRFIYLTETIFSLSNGHLGIRATLDEGAPTHLPGTFVNGFHETWPIVHPESAYGLATTGQTIVNAPDASVMMLEVDGVALVADNAVAFRRALDFRTGILERTTTWQTPDGTTVRALHRRLVSMTRREIAGFSLRFEVDRPATISLVSRVVNRQDEVALGRTYNDDDPRRAAALAHRVLEPRAASVDDLRFIQSWTTANSRQGLVVGVQHTIGGSAPNYIAVERDPHDFGFRYEFAMEPGAPATIEKLAAYLTAGDDVGMEDRLRAEAILSDAADAGFDELASEQRSHLARFWDLADVRLGDNPEEQRAVRWTLFQLHQAAVCLEDYSIPAKGLTGQAYDGHYFWDTEIYLLPFLVYTDPDRAAEILRFRHRLLPAARRRAHQLAQEGALFPWRTINGEEASAYFPAGTAQYHINADIVFGLRKYIHATGDDEFLWSCGVELAVETARMWQDLGFYRGNRFHIHGVTGPDEYTALVDDNAYTNAMARMNLRFASTVVERMRIEEPERFAELADRLVLADDEAKHWRLAADAMFIPHDGELGITPQDADFLSKEPWDFTGTPASMYPLLLHFHPLVIYRFQVLKQADVVLADFLLGDEFSPDLKRANFDFYGPITTGDSSLSASVESIAAAEIGYLDRADELFRHALFMDLADLAGNTTDGVHLASAGGVWMAIVYGLAGVRDYGGQISIDPRLSEAWGNVRFSMLVRGTRLTIEIDGDAVSVQAEGGTESVVIGGEPHVVEPGRPISVRPTNPIGMR